MDTQNLNITPENGDSDSKSDKAAKAKKMAGKVAQFAGAAGIGVAGTMAANAMNTHDDEPEVKDETVTTETEETTEEAAVTPEEFDPNDIMIEEVEETVIDEGKVESPTNTTHEDELAMVDEPHPITGENISHEDIAMIDVDEPNIDNELIDVPPYMDGGHEGWDNFDDPTTLLADNGDLDDIDSDHNILDDILNA
ncbi:MAG: hypothetical protein HDS45_02075 [Bacteroides sp.]|nr:hypothetical protein [Bacteroides sp.]